MRTLKVFAAAAFLTLLAACEKNVNVIDKEAEPELHARCATSVAQVSGMTSARLGGMATVLNAKESIATAYFYYSTTAASESTALKSGNKLEAGKLPAGGGAFDASLENLVPGTTYYFAAVAEVDGMEFLGEVKSFDLGFGVETKDATDVESASATLNATVFAGAGKVDEAWFLIGVKGKGLDSLRFSGSKIPASVGTDGNFSAAVSKLRGNNVYHYLACAKISETEYYGEVRNFTTPVDQGGVDLGLSVKWHKCNLGAEEPDEYGDYYAWGETETKAIYEWENYLWCDYENGCITKYILDNGAGTVDDNGTLDPEDDVATVLLGAPWRMPTLEEIEELVATQDSTNYTWEWKTINEHDGFEVTYLGNDNSIFLPAAGLIMVTDFESLNQAGAYFSSNIDADDSSYAYILYLDSRPKIRSNEIERCLGASIRPVSD